MDSTGASRIFLVVVIATVAIVLMMWYAKLPVAGPESTVWVKKPSGATVKDTATTSSASAPLWEVDTLDMVGNLDKEFEQIDTDIRAL